ncbi:MAG: GNAT family N-acetyltransferase [Bacillota bacterium]|nr:GNAT family N-acetyltransferase [Bacillota bacterium]
MKIVYRTDGIYFYSEDDKILAEVTFPAINETTVDINHTYVSEEMRGKGVADQLLTMVTDYLRQNHLKAKLTCSYAVKWFGEHPEALPLVAK